MTFGPIISWGAAWLPFNVLFPKLLNFMCHFSPSDHLCYYLRYTSEEQYYREWHLNMLIIRYVICMRSYVTSIYVHVICMPLLCHSNVFVCYSHNTNMSLAYNLHVFAYHLYVINMSTVSHSYVLVYYPHAIRMSLLYQSYIIRMQLVCNHMSLTCVFYMKPSKQIKWYIRLMVVTPC